MLFDPIAKSCNYKEYVSCYTDISCPQKEGLFPHPSDCSKYVNCFDFRPYVQSCPGGLWFDVTTGGCEAASNVACPVSWGKNEHFKLKNSWHIDTSWWDYVLNCFTQYLEYFAIVDKVTKVSCHLQVVRAIILIPHHLPLFGTRFNAFLRQGCALAAWKREWKGFELIRNSCCVQIPL